MFILAKKANKYIGLHVYSSKKTNKYIDLHVYSSKKN